MALAPSAKSACGNCKHGEKFIQDPPENNDDEYGYLKMIAFQDTRILVHGTGMCALHCKTVKCDEECRDFEPSWWDSLKAANDVNRFLRVLMGADMVGDNEPDWWRRTY